MPSFAMFSLFFSVILIQRHLFWKLGGILVADLAAAGSAVFHWNQLTSFIIFKAGYSNANSSCAPLSRVLENQEDTISILLYYPHIDKIIENSNKPSDHCSRAQPMYQSLIFKNSQDTSYNQGLYYYFSCNQSIRRAVHWFSQEREQTEERE